MTRVAPQTKKQDHFIARILRTSSRNDRVYERLECCIPATLYYVDRDYETDGLIMELSRGGVLFREASHYILDRRGSEVEIRAMDLRLPGVIVTVRPRGYGVRLRTILDQNLVSQLSSDFQV